MERFLVRGEAGTGLPLTGPSSCRMGAGSERDGPGGRKAVTKVEGRDDKGLA